jgi:hypothetical protein
VNDYTVPYRRRRPEHTLLYRTVQTHSETRRALPGFGPDRASPPGVQHGKPSYVVERVLHARRWACSRD